MAKKTPSHSQDDSLQPAAQAASNNEFTSEVLAALPTEDKDAKQSTILEIPSMNKPTDYLSFASDRIFLRPRANTLDEPKVATIREIRVQFPAFSPIIARLPLAVGASNIHSTELPPGLTVISGPTQGGKTMLVRGMARFEPLTRFLTVEPYDSSDEILDGVVAYNSVDSAIGAAVHAVLQGSKHLPVIDSFRESLYEISGAAGSKGVTNAFFTALTRVSNGLARADLSMVAIVNPMHEEAEYIKEFLSKLSSAVPCLIQVTETKVTGTRDVPRIVCSGTISKRPLRQKTSFRFDSDEAVESGDFGRRELYPLDEIHLDEHSRRPPSASLLAAVHTIQSNKGA